MGHFSVEGNRDRGQAKAQTGVESGEGERPEVVMLHTKLFGYVDPRHGQPLARCGKCELTWCVALRERHGASALGVDLREQWMMGHRREYTARKKDRG
jgi:hypothetical protein